MALVPLASQRLRRNSTVINLADGHTTKASSKGVAAHPTVLRALHLDILEVPHLRDTFLSGAQVTKSHCVFLSGERFYALQKPHPTPDASRIHAAGHFEEVLYVMDTSAKASAVKVGRAARANKLILDILNHTADKAIDVPRRANPSGTGIILEDKGRP